MNSQPPAGSFSTHRQKSAQPRVANIATREVLLRLEKPCRK